MKFDVEAHKFYADGSGKETEAPMDEQVEVGVFSAKPGDKGFDASKVLLLHKVPDPRAADARHRGGGQPPTWVGIDPYNKRIDRNSDDNLTQVDMPEVKTRYRRARGLRSGPLVPMWDDWRPVPRVLSRD